MAIIDIHIHGTIDNQKLDNIMTKLSEIQAAHEEMKTALTEEIQQINDKITQLETNIQDGGSEEERTALLADIKSQTERIKGIVQDSTPNPETPQE